MEELQAIVYHVPNRELSKEERREICEKIAQVYKEGFWIEQKVSLGEAGTLIILVKD